MPVTTTTLRDAEHFVSYTSQTGTSVTAPRDLTVTVYTPATPGRYPVIVYSHGHGGSGEPTSGAGATAQALADQGYIVLAPTHLDSRSAYPTWFTSQFTVSNTASGLHRAADVQFTLDQLQALMATQPAYSADASSVIVAGHSHGAFTAGLIAGLQSFQYASQALSAGNPYGISNTADPRFDAAILLSPQGMDSSWARLGPDAWDQIRIPVLTITGTQDSEPGGLIDWQGRLDPFGESDFGRTAAVVYRDAAHNDIGGNTAIPGITASIASLIDRFIDAYVMGDPAALTLFATASALAQAVPNVAQAFTRPIAGTPGTGVVVGTAGADTLTGLASDDLITSGAGSDLIDGGPGIDTLVLPGLPTAYFIEASGAGWRVYDGLSGVDTIVNVERIQFGDGQILSPQAATLVDFDADRYIAGYPDLVAAFRLVPESAGYLHWVTYGQAEGRSPTLFDPLAYIAANPDLIRAFGADPDAGTAHFLTYGFAEGRTLRSFDALTYISLNPDLVAAFGYNADAGYRHYITYGFDEGRTTGGLSAAAASPDHGLAEASLAIESVEAAALADEPIWDVIEPMLEPNWSEPVFG